MSISPARSTPDYQGNALISQFNGKIPGSRCQVEHAIGSGTDRGARRRPSPADVHAAGMCVDRVVAPTIRSNIDSISAG